MQLIKISLLESSKDATVAELFKLKSDRTIAFEKRWTASKLYSSISAEVDFQVHFQGQNDRRGLGHGIYTNNPSAAGRRKLATTAYLLSEEKHRVAHSTLLALACCPQRFSNAIVLSDFSLKVQQQLYLSTNRAVNI